MFAVCVHLVVSKCWIPLELDLQEPVIDLSTSVLGINWVLLCRISVGFEQLSRLRGPQTLIFEI